MTELHFANFTTDAGFEIRDVIDGDGFTVEGRLVPFDVITPSAGRTSAGSDRPYRERFRRGAFAKSIRESLHRVVLRPEHGAAPVGRAVALEERSDGLYGTFRVSDVPAGRDMLTLIRDGVTPDLSIEFLPVRHSKVGGILDRTEVALRGVAASYRPAYPGAQVLAVRDDAPGSPRRDAAARELARMRAVSR
jgi:HK97 family phage prohead protease